MAKRLFIAVDIIPEPEFIEYFIWFKEIFRAEKIKWVKENKLHLTLKFLGDTEETQIPGIIHQLSDLQNIHNQISFNLKGLGYFGSRNNPRIIYSKIEDENELLHKLSLLINESLSEIGIKKEEKEFRAHLTLGRIKFLKIEPLFFSELEKHHDIFFQYVKVNEFILYESILEAQGPIYIPIQRFLI